MSSSPPKPATRPRVFYLDNFRTYLTALVIYYHLNSLWWARFVDLHFPFPQLGLFASPDGLQRRQPVLLYGLFFLSFWGNVLHCS
jgi:hypothetical protein